MIEDEIRISDLKFYLELSLLIATTEKKVYVVNYKSHKKDGMRLKIKNRNFGIKLLEKYSLDESELFKFVLHNELNIQIMGYNIKDNELDILHLIRLNQTQEFLELIYNEVNFLSKKNF